MTEGSLGREELRELLFDDLPPPPPDAQQEMFDRTFAGDGGDGAELLPPDHVFEPELADADGDVPPDAGLDDVGGHGIDDPDGDYTDPGADLGQDPGGDVHDLPDGDVTDGGDPAFDHLGDLGTGW